MGRSWSGSWDLCRWRSRQISQRMKRIKQIKLAADVMMKQSDGIGDRVRKEYGDLTYRIIGAAMAVHRTLGPGFPESVYQKALAVEFGRQGIEFERERPVQVVYEGVVLGDFYLDSLVENRIIVELKAVESLSSQHQQQAISYLAASGLEVALFINFGAGSLQYKRLLPPRSVQQSPAYRARLRAWQNRKNKSAESAKSADKFADEWTEG